MAYESLIPESEASTLAAVSTRTLERFAEAGYLRVETGMNGIKLFSRSEVEHLFGVKNKRIEKTVYHSSPPAPAPVESRIEETPVENASPVSSQPEQATAPLSDSRSLDLQKQISSLESELASMHPVEIRGFWMPDAQLQDIRETRLAQVAH
jgi:DNA-binding transcriptional MerR regulator